MSTFADTLSPQERKRGQIYAFFACCFGCVSEIMVDSSAIIIIYMSMLGASKTEVMFSTSFTGISGICLLIPSAFIINRIGMRKALSIACVTGCSGFLLMAFAPLFGSFSKLAVICGCLIYCLQRSLYGATWYPMLDAFLRPQDRGKFFGTMRYSYMIIFSTLFYLLGKLMGPAPSTMLMQIIVGLTGLLLLGRMYCMLQFPENKWEKPHNIKLKYALALTITNGPLVSYAVYTCLLALAYTSLVPVTLIYLKEYVKLPPGQVQMFSTIALLAGIAGFLVYNFLQKKLQIKRLELIVHTIFLAVALGLALLDKNTPGFVWLAGAIYFFNGFANSIFMCNNSSELLALARPGNKTMAMAFMQTYQNIGVTISRIGTAFILGTNLLAPSWKWGIFNFSSYQTLFLMYAAIAAILLTLIPSLPAVVPHHRDYYEP